MKKIYSKLIAITMALVLSVSVVVMSSYAWFVLSSSPAMEGMQITIGGGTTILVAADMSREIDGKVYHYPGNFNSTLNFSKYQNYDYLKNLCGLTPVSTADGINWFIPDYYDLTDEKVQAGTALAGTIKLENEFIRDAMLVYANLTEDEEKLVEQGHYIYLDFWVVSPGENYSLRVSTGEENNEGGSFAIDLMDAVESESGLTLAGDGTDASASVRIGFLVNPDPLQESEYAVYQGGSTYSEQYSSLRGSYTEPGSGSIVYSGDYHFTVYEPNGDYHPGQTPVENGCYAVTSPLGLTGDGVSRVSIKSRLTVQKKNEWSPAAIGEGTQIEQRFKTAIIEQSFGNSTLEAITSNFYQNYLGGQVAPYVSPGQFVKNTENLYNAAAPAENADCAVVSGDYLSGEYTAGATDDVFIIELEKNVPQRIRMFIWLEGEDIDCVNNVNDSSMAINIELAGSNFKE